MFRLRTNVTTLATVLLLVGFVDATQAADNAAATFSPPWNTPQEAARYIVVSVQGAKSMELINVVTGEALTPEHFDGRQMRKRSYPVQGHPGRFLTFFTSDAPDPLAAPGLANNAGLVPKDRIYLANPGGTGWNNRITPYLMPEGGRERERGSDDPTNGCRFSDDLRRAVWIRDGDIWRGDIDWTTGEIVHPKQVTHVGQFTFEGSGGHERPVFWSGNELFVEGGFNPSKPLVRINLVTGAIAELGWLMYEAKSIAGEVAFDPAERVALHAVPGQLRIIDLTSGKAFKVSQRFDDDPWWKARMDKKPRLKQQLDYYAGSNVEQLPWLSDSVVVTLRGLLDITDGTVDPYENHMIAGDVAGATGASLLLTFGQQIGRTTHTHLLRADPPVMALRMAGTQDQGGYYDMIGLADLGSGAITAALRTKQGQGAMWVDAYRCVYSVTGKGLTGNGAYLYDRRTGKSVRLASYTDIREPIAVAGGDTIVFTRGQDIYRVGADGGGLKKVASNAFLQATFMPRAISLDDGDPWAIEQPPQLAMFTSGKQGDISPRDRLKQAVRDKPEGVRDFALRAFHEANESYVLSNLYDPVRVALAAVKVREKFPGKPLPNATAEADYSQALDKTKSRAYFRTKAIALYAHEDAKPTDAQLDDLARRCTARMAAQPSTQMKWIDKMFMEEAQPLSASLQQQEQEQPKQQQAQQAKADDAANSQQEQKQDEADDRGNVVDETLDKADDVKKKINRLRGLFGR